MPEPKLKAATMPASVATSIHRIAAPVRARHTAQAPSATLAVTR
ncbi:hypothetical protein [Chiayiivirga sp.]|jgi:hypothetical protein|nr:hypothetical protein [Chiayiivirga sp.]